MPHIGVESLHLCDTTHSPFVCVRHDSCTTHTCLTYVYGVATISRLLKMIGLFCRILSLLWVSFAKETYHFKEPTNRSHPIVSLHVVSHSTQCRMCDISLSRTHSYVSHNSFVCVTRLIRMCHTTHSYVWHDSFVCVTRLIRMCHTTHSYVWHDSFMTHTCLTYVWASVSFHTPLSVYICVAWLCHVWHDSFITHTCD